MQYDNFRSVNKLIFTHREYQMVFILYSRDNLALVGTWFKFDYSWVPNKRGALKSNERGSRNFDKIKRKKLFVNEIQFYH